MTHPLPQNVQNFLEACNIGPLADWQRRALACALENPGIEITVPGVPQVQGNHRVNRHGYTYDANKKLAPWRRTVALCARRAMTAASAELIEGPVHLDLEFVMPRTKAMRKDPPPPHTQRPDSSKLQRAIEDALTGIAYHDDSQITHLTVHKRRANLHEQPHATITITPAPKGPNHP